MTALTVEYFNKIKDYENGNVITLPPYHGCGHRNKNGTRILIDYARGY